jgi:MFS family permease
MTAASIEGPVPRSVAIGINMSAVAIGGMIWAPILSGLADEVGPHQTITIAAAVVLGAGGLACILLTMARATAADGTGAVGLFRDILTQQPRIFVSIFIGFFLISFGALSAIGHAAPLVRSLDVDGPGQLAPVLASAGYVIGALAGGPLTDIFGGRRVLFGIAGLTGCVLILLFAAPSVALGLFALAVVGGCFGATATAHPVTVGYYYGVAAVPRVYGRLAVAYGLGGLLGPYATGAIYDAEASYGTALALMGGLGLLGALAYGSLPRQNRKNATADRATERSS